MQVTRIRISYRVTRGKKRSFEARKRNIDSLIILEAELFLNEQQQLFSTEVTVIRR